jgi:hypothetical protein
MALALEWLACTPLNKKGQGRIKKHAQIWPTGPALHRRRCSPDLAAMPSASAEGRFVLRLFVAMVCALPDAC